MKIGIIQTRGIGDIVIAIPIANHFIRNGSEVYWPIDSSFYVPFKTAFPLIKFIPLKKEIPADSAEYFFYEPNKLLISEGCEKIFCLYSHLSNGFNFGQTGLQKKLAGSVSFDIYKYAITGVPFSEKWNFFPTRNISQENALFDELGITKGEKYIVQHNQGSNASFEIVIENEFKNYKLITINSVTNNFFDWLKIIENAYKLYLLDSVYANIVEQMNFENKKILILRSPSPFTPVFKNSWEFA